MPAPRARASDTIRILVSTDNHVGYNERDPVRGDDSWKTFDEIMTLARERDVDMVLLAGDLFHDNKPSRKALYQVMRSLRANCYGDKPCELQMLSDSSEHFAGAFNHVNYDDENINVAIPVFSIHGNHDDPAGEGHLAALDILSMSGLLNYYGRTPEADKIDIKPVLLQKGQTKLALYGMSNVRDERLFRTFRDGHVRFFQPSMQPDDWFNIMSVHQNHHAYTETSYLPERFLPSWMDLIIWGHEHECKIDPQLNVEMGFKVMQPGSSVATSLVKGEAEPKHVAIVSVTGTDYVVEPIRLKSVRPFIVKEIALKDYPEACDIAMHEDQDIRRSKMSHFLEGLINELIVEAQQSWQELQDDTDDVDEDEPPPKPIVRLRIETTPPEGGTFNFDNPQRFSARFADKVANALDVVQMHRKRSGLGTKKQQPDEPMFEEGQTIKLDSEAVQKLVNEYLAAQSLQVLPQNSFSDAVGQFVDKDDKHAMEEFLVDSLKHQQKGLIGDDEEADDEDEDELDEDKIQEQMEKTRVSLENAHASGELKRKPKKGKLKPKPPDWDSDVEGMSWANSLMSVVYEEDKATKKKTTRNEDEEEQEEDDDDVSVASARPARGRGSRGGRGGKAAAGTTRKAAAPKKAPAKATGRGKKKQVSESEEEEDNDVIMLDDSDGAESASGLFMTQDSSRPATQARTQRSVSPVKKAAPRATRGRGRGAATATASRASGTQQTLSFGTQANATSRTNGRAAASKPAASKRNEPSDDEISDDDDAFEPPPAAQRRTGRR